MRSAGTGVMMAVACLLSACPAPGTTLYHSVESTMVPDTYCLLDKLKEISSGRSITYTTEDLDAGTRHSYHFGIATNFYYWSVFVKPDGKVTLSDGVSIDDAHPEMLPVVRDRLLKVEAAIRNQCGLGNAMDAAKEECHGKACPAALTGG
jgi:hypothetical protein